MSQQTAWYDEPLDNELNSNDEKSPNTEQSGNEPQKEMAKEPDQDIPKQSDTQKLELSSEDRRLLDEAAARERFSNEIAMAEKSVPGFDRGKVLHKLEEINKKDPAMASNLFSSQGLELIWYKYFAHQASSDNVMDSHRARMENFNPNEAIEKINKGEASSADMVDFYSHLGEICK
ncbi:MULTISPECIES: hypothetical protein [Campylobacter]|uniref:hypothetical protein n=1 Tax=Campylobacter TaxID=194 RepID=UPI000A337321|nr:MULTISPECIES: hypothetical protein [unclassified Campylobacter]MCR8679590.1 hypothetical protein [Campylobacter sp. RM19072]